MRRPRLTPPRVQRIGTGALALLLAAGCASRPPAGRIAEGRLALAARAQEVLARAGTTPGREYANRLRNAPCSDQLRQLKGEAPPGAVGLSDAAVAGVAHFVDLAEQGLTWPLPPLARVPFAAVPPQIDGRLEDAAWARALTYTNTFPFNSREPGGPATAWHLLWDKENLYVAYACADPDVVAPIRPRDDAVYDDDCVEIFLLPELRFRTYWELVVSPSGSIFDSVECKKADDWGMTLDPAQDIEGLQVAVQVSGTLNRPGDLDEGYTVELAVPFRQLPGYARLGPKAGDRLHFMLVRLDRSGERLSPYAYQPLLGWGQNIWNHAVMELVEP